MIYERIVRHLDEDERLEVDAILGDEEAVRERAVRRREALASAGVEIG